MDEDSFFFWKVVCRCVLLHDKGTCTYIFFYVDAH